MRPILEIENLRILAPGKGYGISSYEEKLLLDIPYFSLHEGEHCAIVGDSGAGKTIFVRSIAGLLPPSLIREGSIHVPQRISWVDQDSRVNFNPSMTVARQMNWAYQSAKKKGLSPLRWEEGAELMNLSPDLALRFPEELSGGQVQRMALLFALIQKPQLLIADEVTAALDPIATRHVIEAMKKALCVYPVSVLFITHDYPSIQELCDRSIHIRQGRITQ